MLSRHFVLSSVCIFIDSAVAYCIPRSSSVLSLMTFVVSLQTRLGVVLPFVTLFLRLPYDFEGQYDAVAQKTISSYILATLTL